ncbi:MAG: glycosyltransferase family 39 protein [Cyanobacteria bacterium P01_H01_bin.58]
MTTKLPPSLQMPRSLRWIRLVAIALLILSITFRFTHLERKVYWHDEVYTSMAITARPGQYLNDGLFQNKLVKPADLLAYQDFVPELTFWDMLVRKGLEDVQHPPVYYVLLWSWTKLWGTSPAVIRGFSALLSLLLLPALYWFCLELFEASLGGWVAIAVFAVSPFHLVFGQEAREYGVWTVLIFVSSALLLRATRSPSRRNWILYGASMVTMFYTALFSLFVAIGHFIYVLGIDPENRFLQLPIWLGRRTIFCFLTLLAVAFLFIPWLYFILVARDTLDATISWTAVSLPLLTSLQSTVLNFSRSFVDFNLSTSNAWGHILAVPVLLFQGYAVYILGRTAPKRIGWFVLTLIGSTALLLLLPDILLGGQRFTITRYLIPCVVGLQLAVVYALSIALTQTRTWQSSFAKLVFSLLIGVGILSCSVYAQADTWWNKELSSNYYQVAALINTSDRPLVITDAYSYNPASTIALSYLLEPTTPLLLMPAVGDSFPAKKLPIETRTVFLFNLPEIFRQQFETQYPTQLTRAFQDRWNDVWQGQLDSP